MLHDDMNEQFDIDRLRWQCRRGMLELDTLLEDFLDQQFAALASRDQRLFVELLTCSDTDLQAWLIGGVVPAEPRYVQLIQQLRA